MGHRRGVILLRFDGTGRTTFPEQEHPRTQVMKLVDLRAHLPASTPVVSPETRSAAIAARRRHVQRRFGF